MIEEADVAVIGAGFAGLQAARLVVAAGKRAIVLEARARIGGRTTTDTRPGRLELDLGGQWIGPCQRRVSQLVKDLDIPMFPTYEDGASILDEDGVLTRYHGTIPRMGGVTGAFALANLGVAIWRMDRLAASVDPTSPWTAPDAARMDASTLADWSRGMFASARARRLFEAGFRVVFGAEPEALSLLHVAFYVRSAGCVDQLISTKGGAQATRFRHGTSQLARKLAEALGTDLRLECPVDTLRQDETGVTVMVAGAPMVRARSVIVAVPISITSRITFDPPLPTARDSLCSQYTMGATSKFFAIYPQPFWRPRGLNGQAVAVSGPITTTFDASLPGEPLGVLLAFAVGSGAEELRQCSPQRRRSEVISALVRLYGPDAAEPLDYVEKIWADEEHSGGCPTANLSPGSWTGPGESIRRPHRRVHWAGTETATEWCGYIEGALESGERAAREVLAAS